MKPQSAKAKGRRLQQLVAAALLEAFPALAEDDVRSTPMGAPGEDVRLSPTARELVPFAFECKNAERVNVWDAIRQCACNTPVGCTPVVVIKKNAAPPYALLPFADFVRLIAPPPREPDDDDDGDGARRLVEALEAAIRRWRAGAPTAAGVAGGGGAGGAAGGDGPIARGAPSRGLDVPEPVQTAEGGE